MDCGSVNQRITDFHVSNGSEFVRDGGRLLYATGAFRDVNPMGILMPPPQDTRKCAEMVARYYKIKLALAIEEFDLFKRQHLQAAHYTLREKIAGPVSPAADVVKKLKELKKKVRKARRLWDKATADVEANISPRRKELDEMNERNRNAAQELLDEIDGIEI